MASFGYRLNRWFDECKMAFSGIVLATREWKFLIAFGLSFIVFGTLMNLLSGSFAGWDLFWAVDFGGKMRLLGQAFLANFGVSRALPDWALTFAITLLQSILIGLVVLVWQKKRRRKLSAEAKNLNNVSDAGLVTGLAILGSGCPTCGTTLLAPLLGTLLSSGGFALAGVLSGLITVAAVVLALFALKRIGKDAYVMIIAERYEKRHPQNNPKEDKQ